MGSTAILLVGGVVAVGALIVGRVIGRRRRTLDRSLREAHVAANVRMVRHEAEELAAVQGGFTVADTTERCERLAKLGLVWKVGSDGSQEGPRYMITPRGLEYLRSRNLLP